MLSIAETSVSTLQSACNEDWSYEKAFSRHRGLFTASEQDRLRKSRVAIAGMGGVGGVHLATLARLGVGAFHIADPDTYEVANFNRQYGASMRTIGRNKTEVMAAEGQAINPEAEVLMFTQGVTVANVAQFLEGVDILVDGIDFFAIETRRLLFREARRRGIWAVTAGPAGFSTAWLVFSPTGLSFDDYFDLRDGMSQTEQLVAFLVGLAPRATHRPYMDMSRVDWAARLFPCSGLACNLCAGVVAAEVIKILLRTETVRAAPWYCQFDAYRHTFHQGRLRWGNRHPWQRLKRWWLMRGLSKLENARSAGGKDIHP